MKKTILTLIISATCFFSSCGHGAEDKANQAKSEVEKAELKDTIIIGQIQEIYYQYWNDNEQYMAMSLYNDSLHNYYFICLPDPENGSLPARFILRRAQFYLQHAASFLLPAQFIARHAKFCSLPAEFSSRRAEFLSRHAEFSYSHKIKSNINQ